MFDPLAAAYETLKQDGQVCHEADVDGYHLYMADTSFGDGPVFHASGHGYSARFRWRYEGGFEPADSRTSADDLAWITPLLAQAQWVNLLRRRQQQMGYQP